MQPSPSPSGCTADEPATIDLSGRCVGNEYVLICPVGQGATGTVWRGIQRTTGEQVAVKLLHVGLLRQPKLVTRFVQERTILMMVRHENIVGVRDLFSVGESLGLVMDFVAGGSLRERLRAAGTLEPAEAARLLAQVAAALTEAHGLGIVHRDVKPDNILLQASDNRLDVRLTDFGIARVLDAAGLTTPHAIIGTPHYMAPEVISGGDAGPPADVYALGIVLYELLCGRTPYAGEPLAVLRRHLDDLPRRPDGMPDEAWSVIQDCVDKDPARRPAADELGTRLRDLARQTAGTPALPAPVADGDLTGHPAGPSQFPRGPVHPSAARPPRRRPRNGPRSWVWGRRGALVALVAGSLAASGVGGYRAWELHDNDAAPATAPTSPEPGTGAAGAAPSGPAPSPGEPSAQPGPAAGLHGAGAPAGSGPARPAGDAGTGASAGPGRAGASAKPGPAGGPAESGPWRCRDTYSWDLGHPVLAKPCHALGGSVRAVAHMEAVPGVQADISVSIENVDTGETVGGPYTCEGVMFTDFALKHSCGPVDMRIPRGHRYVVVQDWRYTARSLLPGGTARGPEFTW